MWDIRGFHVDQKGNVHAYDLSSRTMHTWDRATDQWSVLDSISPYNAVAMDGSVYHLRSPRPEPGDRDGSYEWDVSVTAPDGKLLRKLRLCLSSADPGLREPLVTAVRAVIGDCIYVDCRQAPVSGGPQEVATRSALRSTIRFDGQGKDAGRVSLEEVYRALGRSKPLDTDAYPSYRVATIGPDGSLYVFVYWSARLELDRIVF
ncbi:MAG: hypothetical protein HY321_20680 [Armatimonadetes bacterium]|nr:hypothetical protein [Armatimonadota bacterium]